MRLSWIIVGLVGTSAVAAQDRGPASRFECTQQQAGVGALRTGTAPPACAPPPASMLAVYIVGAADASLCGQCLRIAAPERAVTAFVAGTVAPAGDRHTGDLLADAAAPATVGLSRGTPLSWVTVPCPFDAPIVVDLAVRAGQLHLDVRGAATGIAEAWLERADARLPLERGRGNDFRHAKPGPAPWRIVLEDIHGRRLDLGLLQPGSAQSTRAQFGPCSLLFTDGFEGGDLSSWGRQTGP